MANPLDGFLLLAKDYIQGRVAQAGRCVAYCLDCEGGTRRLGVWGNVAGSFAWCGSLSVSSADSCENKRSGRVMAKGRKRKIKRMKKD